MKHTTYKKSIRREIKSSLGRFIAITAIVALGVGFLTGILSTTPDMKHSVDKYYDENHFNDIFIKSNLGFTDEDIQLVKDTKGVESVIPEYSTDALMNNGDVTNQVVRIYGVDWKYMESKNAINRLTLMDGRFPQSDTECVVLSNADAFDTYKIGDTLTMSEENTNYRKIGDTYNRTSFTVVGIVSSPFYFSKTQEISTQGAGKVNAVIYISQEAYALDVYTDLYLTVKGAADEQAFTVVYDDVVKPVFQDLKTLGKTRSQLRYDELYAESRKELDDGWATYEQEKIDTAQQLEDAQNQITTAEQEIADNEVTLAEKEQELADGRKAADKASADYEASKADTEAALTKAEADLAAQKEQIDTTLGQLPREDPDRRAAYIAYEDARDELAAKRKEFENASKTIASTYSKLDQGEADLADGKAQLEQAKADLEQAKTDYATNSEEAETKLADAYQDLLNGESDLKDMENGKWYVLDRSSNVTYASYEVNVEKVEAIAKVFPLFFFLIAALVTLTTMTRMIEDDRTQIGIMKALGYGKSTILSKYVTYSGIAAAIGCIAGLAIGFTVLPTLINSAYDTMYHLPKFMPQINFWYGGLSCGLEILCTIGVTIIVCRRELAEKPALLMRPKTPKAGSHIFLEHIPFLWKHFSFSQKATARNIFRYKGHLYMTIVGIAGCTALIMTGLSFRSSIQYAADIQYNDLMKYNLEIDLDSTGLNDDLKAYLGDTSYLDVYEKSLSAQTSADSLDVTLLAADDMKTLSNYIALRNRTTGEEPALDDKSVILSEKTADMLGLSVGDKFTLTDNEDYSQELTLTGITENYIGSRLYVSKALLPEGLTNNAILATVNLADTEAGSYLTALLKEPGVASASFLSDERTNLDSLLVSLNYIVFVLIIAAGLLAIIVLYNLTNINIMERSKELATLKVLGYHLKEVAMYIFREAIILSIMSSLIGLAVGFVLERYIIIETESYDMMFGRGISWISPVLSFVITIIFSLIVDLLMIPKLKNIKMSESMKTVD